MKKKAPTSPSTAPRRRTTAGAKARPPAVPAAVDLQPPPLEIVFDGSNLVEAEPFSFNYKEIPKVATRKLIQSLTLEIKGAYRRSLVTIIETGRLLAQGKQELSHGLFKAWVEEEFGQYFSYDTATSYVNVAALAEEYSQEELDKLPLATLYTIARSTVPTEARERVIASGQTASITKETATDIINQYRQANLMQAGVNAKAQRLLLQAPISERREELLKLAKLPEARQISLARTLSDDPKLNFRRALAQVREHDQTRASAALVTVEPVTLQLNRSETYRGDWVKLLGDLPNESVDLCFAELPLAKSALPDYRVLAEALYPVLKPGGMLLAFVGQVSIQFVGPLLEPLQVIWTFNVRRRPGNSPRVVGRISFASSYLPCSLSCKPPMPSIGGLIDDLRLEKETMNNDQTPAEAMSLNFGNETEPVIEPTSIENSVSYYIERLLAGGNQNKSFLHLVTDGKFSFDLLETAQSAAVKAQAVDTLQIIGV